MILVQTATDPEVDFKQTEYFSSYQHLGHFTPQIYGAVLITWTAAELNNFGRKSDTPPKRCHSDCMHDENYVKEDANTALEQIKQHSMICKNATEAQLFEVMRQYPCRINNSKDKALYNYLRRNETETMSVRISFALKFKTLYLTAQHNADDWTSGADNCGMTFT